MVYHKVQCIFKKQPVKQSHTFTAHIEDNPTLHFCLQVSNHMTYGCKTPNRNAMQFKTNDTGEEAGSTVECKLLAL